MSIKKNKVEYRDLPSDFWDDVVYYEYFVSFSGFVEREPFITVWTKDGKQYYLNVHELRDGIFARVIPFFESMADKKKIENGDYFYLDWEQIPSGWKYYKSGSNHCFMPADVFEEYDKWMKAEKNENYPKEATSVEDYIVKATMWKELLKRAYKEVMGVCIDDSVNNYIRMDELIHVYYEPYVGESLYIDKITKEDIDRVQKAAVWEIEYTTKFEGLYNLIDIVIFFETDKPIYMKYEFERDFSNKIDEDEFMGKLMSALGCNLGSREEGYSFDEAPKGFTVFKFKDDSLKTYWIRDDLYQSNYHNVVEPLENYTGSWRYIHSPICACIENKYY